MPAPSWVLLQAIGWVLANYTRKDLPKFRRGTERSSSEPPRSRIICDWRCCEPAPSTSRRKADASASASPPWTAPLVIVDVEIDALQNEREAVEEQVDQRQPHASQFSPRWCILQSRQGWLGHQVIAGLGQRFRCGANKAAARCLMQPFVHGYSLDRGHHISMINSLPPKNRSHYIDQRLRTVAGLHHFPILKD